MVNGDTCIEKGGTPWTIGPVVPLPGVGLGAILVNKGFCLTQERPVAKAIAPMNGRCIQNLKKSDVTCEENAL